MEVSNSLTQINGEKKMTFSQIINTDGYQKLINSTIKDPKRATRFITTIVSAVSSNPALQKCEAKTILSAAFQGEALELSPSPTLGEYALVPYGKKWNAELNDYEVYEAQFQIMTNGKVQLAMRSGLYEDLEALEIKEGEYKGKDRKTGKPVIEFIEDDDERETKATIGYYAYFKLLNGFFKSVYLPKASVIAHATQYSKSFNPKVFEKVQKGEKLNGWKEEKQAEVPWIAHFDSMALNLALRKVLKNAPKSIEMRTAEDYEDKANNQANLAGMITPVSQEQAENDFFGEEETQPENNVDEETGEIKPKRGRKKAEEVQAGFFETED